MFLNDCFNNSVSPTRFTWDRKKIDKHIEVNQYLDMTQFKNSKSVQCRYKLVSMVIHIGETLHRGHYVAVGDQGAGGNISLLDDHNVSTKKPM